MTLYSTADTMYADILVASGIEALNIILTVVAGVMDVAPVSSTSAPVSGAVDPDTGAADAALLVGQNVYCNDWKLTGEVKRK